MSEELNLILVKILVEGFSVELIKQFVVAAEQSNVEISRRDFLGVKHGDMSSVQRIFKNINNCGCREIFDESLCLDMDEYYKCSASVDLALLAGRLISTLQPSWSDQSSFSLNPTRFYKCADCGLIWQLSKPEKNHLGAWIIV